LQLVCVVRLVLRVAIVNDVLWWWICTPKKRTSLVKGVGQSQNSWRSPVSLRPGLKVYPASHHGHALASGPQNTPSLTTGGASDHGVTVIQANKHINQKPQRTRKRGGKVAKQSQNLLNSFYSTSLLISLSLAGLHNILWLYPPSPLHFTGYPPPPPLTKESSCALAPHKLVPRWQHI